MERARGGLAVRWQAAAGGGGHGEGGSEPQEEDAVLSALDLRNLTTKLIFKALYGLNHLRVLILAGSALGPDDLDLVLKQQRRLEKLDASGCGLQRLPPEELWKSHTRLRLLFLHQNELRQWGSVVAAASPPSLAWLTFHSNPISSQPDYRQLVLRTRPGLMALDFWLVLDNERIGRVSGGAAEADAGMPGFRFTATGSPLPMVPVFREANPSEDPAVTSVALMQELKHQLQVLRYMANRCSAAVCVQAAWRQLHARRHTKAKRDRICRAVLMIQRRVKGLLWKKEVTEYVKDYLAEIDELDLLLNAKEMLRRKAMKLIEGSVHRWWERRKLKKRERRAAEIITRAARGWLFRMRIFYGHLQLEDYPRLYFPQRNAWEFLVLLNVVRQRHGLPPLPRSYEFEEGDVLGVRFPEPEEVGLRKSSLFALRRFSRACIVRPRHAGRFPEHPWDGPKHRLVDDPPAQIAEAYSRLRCRGANVDNRCRSAFLRSCAQGPHPVEALGSEEAHECLALRMLLDGPEAQWPEEAKREEGVLREFMLEARRTGVKTYHRCPEGTAAPRDERTGARDYSGMCWLTQRMLCYRCDTPRIAAKLSMALLRFARVASSVTSLEPVPFLPEKLIRQVSCATVLQAAYRAHRERLRLGCGLHTAAVARRAALCLQRCWRWSLVRRRIQLLAGAAAYVKKVRTNILYLEERLLASLNHIHGVDRYPPMVAERGLRLGYSDEAVVLVRNGGSRRDTKESKEFKRSSSTTLRSPAPRPLAREPQEQRLPEWLLTMMGGLRAVGPDDGSLKRVEGLYGLLTEGVERNEDHAVTLSISSFAHMARHGEGQPGDDRLAAALEASGGQLRFVELRFHSLAQAKQRAFVLFMCTFNTHYRTVVPLLPRHLLHDSCVCRSVLQQWDLYGLHWSPANRVALYRLRQRLAARGEDAVPCCGGEKLWAVPRPCEWGEGEDKLNARSWEARRQEMRENLAAKYGAFAGKIERARRTQEVRLEEHLQSFNPDDAQRLLEAPPAAAGQSEVCIVGALPPCTSLRTEALPDGFGKMEKAAAREAIAAAAEEDLERKRSGRAAVAEWRKTRNEGTMFEDRLMAFYERAEEEVQMTRLAGRARQGPRKTYVEATHLRRERAINRKAGYKSKMAEVERFREALAEDVEAQAVEQLDDVRRRRERIREQKIAKQQRQEANEALHDYISKCRCIERICRREDKARLRQSQAADRAQKVESRRREWARRSRALAERHFACLQQRRRQVDELREQLQTLREERQRSQQDRLQSIRDRRSQDSMLSRLMKAAQEQLDSYASALRGSAADVLGSYEDTLKAFKDLAEKVDDGSFPEGEEGQWVSESEHEGQLVGGRESSSSSASPCSSPSPRSRRGASEPPSPKSRLQGVLPPAGPAVAPSKPKQLPASWSPLGVQLPVLPGVSKPTKSPAAPLSARPEARAWLQRAARTTPMSAR